MITPIRDTHAPNILFSPCHMTLMLHAHIDNHHPPFDHIGHDHGHGRPGHPDDHTGPDFDDAHKAQGLLGLGLNAYAHAQAVHTTHDHPMVQCDHGPSPSDHVGPFHVSIT